MIYPWLHRTFGQLISRYDAGTLHHGILFMGAKSLGKTELCESLAASLLCQTKPRSDAGACGNCKSCLLLSAGSHPDLNIVIPEKTQIGIDQVRSAIAKLNQTAQLSGNKVLVIPNIELMSESASNSLLKTLEEPTANTYLLLTSNEAQKLLPTVLSRCEKITIAAPSYQESASWLKTQDLEIPSQEAMLANANSPLRYLASLSDDSQFNFSDFEKALGHLKSGQESPSRLAEVWKAEASNMSNWLAQYFLNEYKTKQDEKLFNSYQSCLETVKLLSHPGINKSLLLFDLLTQAQAVQKQI
ncbi:MULTISPECIES: DNA polymerase III subunit delta' [Alteromonadaceae]|uniref:DNA-directed DNA polymerase n=1 Tax=Brumicola blandensis TaxID=3075611 RepID=A0AAW8QW85_9ALTE|nr:MULTISPECIES: DNA polymerase III subunit delta' [unclassified Alteromonas]MDT0581366.1 DNA polymerase III subunit delta' [Alteromonas sp. W409]MDT0626994.1 DNA polymerase III subunit delta' [Alteromonas sp. W364]